MTADQSFVAAAAAAVSNPSTNSSETDLALAGLSTGMLVFLAAVWSLVGHYLSSRSRYLSESGTACLLGLAAGLALLACRNRDTAGLVNEMLSFDSAAFFTYLLPPVIFYAGLSVEQRRFFGNLPSILSLGVLGTLLSFVLMSAALYSLAGTTIGLEAQDCLALGAVFAATDSVAVLSLLDPRSSPQLFSLVFGEGIVNDATSVVLLGALARMARQQEAEATAAAREGGGGGGGGGSSVLALAWQLTGNFGYLLLTSACLGVAAGAGVAALLRVGAASQGPHHEMALVGLLSYLAYLIADVLGLSGILSLFCCGAAVSHFALRGGNGNGGGGISDGGGGGDDSVHFNGQHHTVGTPLRNAHDSAGGGDGTQPPTPTAISADGTGWLYETRVPIASSRGAAAANDDEAAFFRRDSDVGAGCDGGGRAGKVLRLIAAPARRLAARAFAAAGGGGSGGRMSAAGTAATLSAFHSLSYVAEGLIFLYLGLDCLDPIRWQASDAAEVAWLVGLLLLFLLAARAASVIPLSLLHNVYAPRHQRLSGRDILVVWWSGLMRGAVSVALVYLNFDTGQGAYPYPLAGRGGTSSGSAALPALMYGNASVNASGSFIGSGGGSLGSGRLLLTSAVGTSRRLFAFASNHTHNHTHARTHHALGPIISVNATPALPGAAATAPVVASAAAVAAAKAAAETIGLTGGVAQAAGVGEGLASGVINYRHHDTLIASTLLVVVASVLVVSTLTKPLLQAVMEADPRKPPLRVLREALCDPWVDATGRLQTATGRLQLAFDRSYRRLVDMTSSGGGAVGGVVAVETMPRDASGDGGGDGGRTSASSIALVTPRTHSIPIASHENASSSTDRNEGVSGSKYSGVSYRRSSGHIPAAAVTAQTAAAAGAAAAAATALTVSAAAAASTDTGGSQPKGSATPPDHVARAGISPVASAADLSIGGLAPQERTGAVTSQSPSSSTAAVPSLFRSRSHTRQRGATAAGIGAVPPATGLLPIPALQLSLPSPAVSPLPSPAAVTTPAPGAAHLENTSHAPQDRNPSPQSQLQQPQSWHSPQFRASREGRTALAAVSLPASTGLSTAESSIGGLTIPLPPDIIKGQHDKPRHQGKSQCLRPRGNMSSTFTTSMAALVKTMPGPANRSPQLLPAAQPSSSSSSSFSSSYDES